MSETIQIEPGLYLDLRDVRMDAMRAAGAGGQNVNKVSSAIHLRYDLHAARLPERVRRRLLASGDSRISSDGVLVLKARRFRTQARNRTDALERLADILRSANREEKRRVPTRPGRGARERRLKGKKINSLNKNLRKKPEVE